MAVGFWWPLYLFGRSRSLPDRIGGGYDPHTSIRRERTGVSYIIVQPAYGPPIAHRSSCKFLRARTANDGVEAVPPGAVICVHCHPVPAELRDDPSVEDEEDGFIIVTDPRFKLDGRKAHHPLCRTIATRQIGGGRWNHRRVAQIPEGVKVCTICKGLPPRQRYVRADGQHRVTRAKPSGEYFIGKEGLLVPKRCPACQSEAINREGGRLWFCYSCDWMGQVVTSTWTRVSSVKVKPKISTEGTGRARLRPEWTKFR